MKTVAIMEVDRAKEVLECLKRESIPTEMQTNTQESGLEISEIKVPDAHYDRACDIVETWNAKLIAEAEEKIRPKAPFLGNGFI